MTTRRQDDRSLPDTPLDWECIPFRLVSRNAGTVALSLDEAAPVPLRGHVPDIERPTGPLWVDDPSGVFDGAASQGSGALAVPLLHLTDQYGRQDMLNGVNGIYAQVGRRFDLASCSSVTNHNWFNVRQNAAGSWPEFHNIVAFTNGVGGIEMYFTHGIDNANGLTSLNGVLIASSANFNTVAHELGHAQGLPDVYDYLQTPAMSMTGLVSRVRLSSDWGSSSDEWYYPPSLSQTNLVKRLLMHGYGPSGKRDLPTGEIHGIWRPIYTNQPYQESPAHTGFFIHASPNPMSN